MFIAAALAVALLSSCSGNKKDDVNFAKYETVKIGPENSVYTNAISIYGKEVLNLYRFAAMEATAQSHPRRSKNTQTSTTAHGTGSPARAS